MSHVYLAFDPEDVDLLFALHEALRKANIPDAFRTDIDSESGAEKAISSSSAVVFLASASSFASHSLQLNIEHARSCSRPLFVIFLDNEKPDAKWADLLSQSRDYDLVQSPKDAIRNLVEALRKIYENDCPVISVMNLKGGVGKTTISSQVFGYLQKERKNKVLLIDFDPQFNLSQFFLSRLETDDRTENDESVMAMFEPSLLTSSVHDSPALDWTRFNNGIFTPPTAGQIVRPLLPHDEQAGCLDLITGQFELTKYAFLDDAESLRLAENNLKQTIDLYRKDYDLIVIDTNPSASFLTQVTLGVTDRILAPILPNEFSLRGLRLLQMILNRFCTKENRPELSVIFNGVPKSQQNAFEQDVRDGVFDTEVDFALSRSVLSNTLYQSAFLDLKARPTNDRPVNRLAAYSARGPFSNDLKRRLAMISSEILQSLK